MIPKEILERTGRVDAVLKDRGFAGREEWWVVVWPVDAANKVVGNHFVEIGPLTKKQAQCRLIGLRRELLDQGWIEGP